MKLVSPVSGLFSDRDLARKVAKVSESLEGRPDYPEVFFDWRDRISHIHFSEPLLDIHVPWGDHQKRAVEWALEVVGGGLQALSFHLSRDFVNCDEDARGRYIAGDSRLEIVDMHRNAEENTDWLRERTDCRILFENNNYFATGAYEVVTLPTVIADLVQSHADGLLLDLAHAVVSSENRHQSLMSYLDALMTCKVQQIHVSKAAVETPGNAIDAHGAPDAWELDLLSDFLGRDFLGQLPITVEYYGDGSRLLATLETYKKCWG